MAPKKQAAPPAPVEDQRESETAPSPTDDLVLTPNELAQTPAVPADVEQVYLEPTEAVAADQLIYTPAIYGEARLHFIRKSLDIDEKRTYVVLQSRPDHAPDDIWENATIYPGDPPRHDPPRHDPAPMADVPFAPLPDSLSLPKNHKVWKKQLIDYLYRRQALVVWRCPQLKQDSRPGESEQDFRVRLAHRAHEERDAELDKLRDRYASKIARIEKQLQGAQKTLADQKSQSTEAVVDTTLSWGETLAGMLFGRKVASRTNIGKTARSIRKTTKVAGERGDVAQAEEKVRRLLREQADLDAELQGEIAALRTSYDQQSITLEQIAIPPRKSDLTIMKLAIAWVPSSR
jgi:hypothetical protein